MNNSPKGPDTEQLHEDSIVIDAHCDTLGRVLEGRWRLGERTTRGQFDLHRAREGGLTAELMATFVNHQRPGDGIRQTLDFIDTFYAEMESAPELVMQALTASDIERAKHEGKIALMLSMEGAEGLGGSLSILRMIHRLGLRVLGLTWNRRNEAADGIGELQTNSGLTSFGMDLVRECNRLGILLDLSHLNPPGVSDVLKLTEAPVVATHSNAYAVHAHPRNLTDVQLERIAAAGGVVGVVPVPPFLGPFTDRAPLEPVFEHMNHLIRVMGEDHVGLGMDFDGVGNMRTEGIEDVSTLPKLTSAMAEHSYSPERIRKILGGNYLRVFRKVLDSS